MPIITVFGIPHKMRNDRALSELSGTNLPVAAALVRGMGITPDKVTVFFPGDLLENDWGGEIIVFVEGLFMRDERTPEVRQAFADAIRDCMVEFVRKHIPKCKMIEVIPRSQRPDDGFADWRKD